MGFPSSASRVREFIPVNASSGSSLRRLKPRSRTCNNELCNILIEENWLCYYNLQRPWQDIHQPWNKKLWVNLVKDLQNHHNLSW